jgi:hypothetical protein
LKKVQRRHERRCGDTDDDERRRGAKQRTTPRTPYQGEPEREVVPQLDPCACRRDDGDEGDDDERWEGPSNGNEVCAGEEAAKWARGLPHVCEHKCLATMKRCRGSDEEGVEDLISDSRNDHDDGEASFSESHCLFTCSINGA